MRKWIGAVCVFLGVVCLLCSVGFVVYNRWEAENAAKVTDSLLVDVQSVIYSYVLQLQNLFHNTFRNNDTALFLVLHSSNPSKLVILNPVQELKEYRYTHNH